MLKQIKLLSLVSFLTISSLSLAVLPDPLEYAKRLYLRPSVQGCVATGMALGTLGYYLAPGHHNESGVYTLVVDKSAADHVAEAVNCAALGAGCTVYENLQVPNGVMYSEPTKSDLIESSLINGAAFWLTNRLAETDVYNSLDRNHPLTRGWVPWFVDLSEKAKLFGSFLLVRSVLKHTRDLLSNPASIQPKV